MNQLAQHAVRIVTLFLTIAVTSIWASSTMAQVVISETFDAGANGWAFYNDAGNFQWVSSAGNPGGCLQASDVGDGRYWGFVASPAMLGNKSCWYGGEIYWDLRTSAVDSTGNNQPDAVIEGPPGIVLVLDRPNPSPNVWVSYFCGSS